MDSLKIEKQIQDISNVKSTIAKRARTGAGKGKGEEDGLLGDLSTTERNNLVPLIAAIKSAESREEALQSLSEDATTILLQTGERGLEILANEIDVAFPEEEISQEQAKAVQNGQPDPFFAQDVSTGELAGQVIGNIPATIGDIGKGLGSSIASGTKGASQAVENFLIGLGILK